MLHLSAKDLEELNGFIEQGGKTESYKEWLAKKREGQNLPKDLLLKSLAGVIPTKKKVEKAEPAIDYPLEFANDQMLNKWLETTLKNIESGSKPLAILESITGLALLEGKLMSLVMSVLNGVLAEDDLENMTVYGLKSFATTRFAKLFFEDFENMMPVMQQVGSPTEVLKIVDKLRQAMANPQAEEAQEESKQVEPQEMQRKLKEWYTSNDATKNMLTDFLVNTFQFSAPPTEQGVTQVNTPIGATSVLTSALSAVSSNLQTATDRVPLTSAAPSLSEPVKSSAAPSEEGKPPSSAISSAMPSAIPSAIPSAMPSTDPQVAPSANQAEAPSANQDEAPSAAPFVQPLEKSWALPKEEKLKSIDETRAMLGGTRRNTAPSQAVTRKRWFEVTLRDVLSGTQ